jgi:glutamate racemase
MKIVIFDSGLGGLVIGKAVMNALPDYDYIYLGDTLHVPYGKRSGETIFDLTKAAVEWLFEQDCQIILIACNTASATALRRLQQIYLPTSPYKDRRVLGVVVPTLEAAIDHGSTKLGLIGTQFTIQSNVYGQELKKLNPEIEIIPQSTPLLVPLIENEGLKWVRPILEDYLKPLQNQNVESLILGCTHYPILKPFIKEVMGKDFPLISQEEIIPEKVIDYLKRHHEHEAKLTRTGTQRFCVTDLASHYSQTASHLFGGDIELETIELIHH